MRYFLLFLLFIFINILGFSRIFHTPWHAIAGPNSVREYDGLPFQYESYLFLRTSAIMRQDFSPLSILHLNTDETRALIPIYFMNLLLILGFSFSLSYHFTDIIFWWLGCVFLYLFLRLFNASKLSCIIATVLAASSPLAAAFIGGFGLHTASSMSLPLTLWAVFKTIQSYKFINFKSIIFFIVLFFTSLIYNYHLFVIPLVTIYLFIYRRSKELLNWFIGIIFYFTSSFLIRKFILESFFMYDQHFNNPWNIVSDRLNFTQFSLDSSEDLFNLLITILLQAFTIFFNVVNTFINSYSVYIIFYGIVGLLFAPSSIQLFCFISIFLTILQSMIYPVPWVIMSSFPFVYYLAALGLIHIVKYISTYLRVYGFSLRLSADMSMIFFCLSVIYAICNTNSDLFGDDSFVISWWGAWYIKR